LPLLKELKENSQRLRAINIARLTALKTRTPEPVFRGSMSHPHRLRFFRRTEDFRVENSRQDFHALDYAWSGSTEI
jgi:hypothetical protein